MAAARTKRTPLRGAVDVICDSTGPLGALSYRVPASLRIHRGDAVEVPFGNGVRRGVVLGPGDPKKATRDIMRRFGSRVAPEEIELAEKLAEDQFSTLAKISSRLAPSRRRGNPPLDAGPLDLAEPLTAEQLAYPDPDDAARWRLLVRAPLVDPAALAAFEAHRIAAAHPGGQVLVLCPTTASVTATLAQFAGGAARLDKVPAADAESPWQAFIAGTLPVAIGTRSAALWSAKQLAGIVVVDEDHPGHREMQMPNTHARDVAVARAKLLGCALTLISAHPTPSAIGSGVKVRPVGTDADWPAFVVVDRNQVAPQHRLLPPAIAQAVTSAGKRPVVLCANRTQHRRCASCRELRACETCTESFCRHSAQTPCPRCGHDLVRWTGLGPERTAALFEERLRRDVRVVDLAGLTKVRDAGVVVVFDIDVPLAAPDLIPGTMAASVLCEAARAAGPGGTVVVGTRDPNNPVLLDICRDRDQVARARADWERARADRLPPFRRIVELRLGRAQPPKLDLPGDVHGPRPCGDGEWEALVVVAEHQLKALRRPIERLRRGGKVRVSVT